MRVVVTFRNGLYADSHVCNLLQKFLNYKSIKVIPGPGPGPGWV